MWSAVVYEEEKSSPCSRSKHTVTQLGNYLYLLAGRNGNVPLKDFWRYDLVNRKWEALKPSGDPPPSLQEHTAVTFGENIYVFGGELGFSGGNETPLWIYESKKNIWRKMKGQKGANVPKGRRGHTALVYRDSVLMYGGYRDLRGSSNEFWIFDFNTESWHLLMNGKSDPPGRHKHSAVLHDENMWIYGGMTDLQERSDLWRFDMVTKKWYLIKCKVNPGPLHSHIACNLHSSMIIFGGERSGQMVNELWRFHFGTKTWQLIRLNLICPQPISESCAVTVSEQSLRDEKSKNENSPPPESRRQRNAHQSYHARERCSPTDPRKRVNADLFSTKFNRNNNYNAYYRNGGGNDYSPVPTAEGVMLPPRRQATTPNSCNLSFLKELSKLSQMNLSRFAQNGRCSYHMLDSNESLNNLQEETSLSEELNRLADDATTATSRLKAASRKTSSSGYVLREVSSLVNTPLTPSDAAKLVYLEGEEAPVSVTSAIEFPTIHQKLHPSQNRNRRSYPLTNSVRFANPLVTPEEPSPEITSDYASCENIHKLLSSNNRLNGGGGSTDRARTLNRDVSGSVLSFSNPNYLANAAVQHQAFVDEKISRGDYVKLNSPADSLLEESSGSGSGGGGGGSGGCVEMTELRPKPPKSLPLINDRFENGYEKRRKYRACSGGRYDRHATMNSICVFLVGGKDQCQIPSLKKPIPVWKLSLTKEVY